VQLERLANRSDYILEIENGEQELSFYAWDRGLHESIRSPTE
jgi:hypothetical protein